MITNMQTATQDKVIKTRFLLSAPPLLLLNRKAEEPPVRTLLSVSSPYRVLEGGVMGVLSGVLGCCCGSSGSIGFGAFTDGVGIAFNAATSKGTCPAGVFLSTGGGTATVSRRTSS